MWVAALILGVMAAHVPAKDIACSATVLTESWNLLAVAKYGYSDYERGAFIVRDGSGQLHLLPWQFDHEPLAAHHRGPIRSEVVAITHTHPNRAPMPSPDDMWLARKTHLPVYVLTRTLITVTDGDRSWRVLSGDWGPVQSANQVTGRCDTRAAR